jgi:hypothetical protein
LVHFAKAAISARWKPAIWNLRALLFLLAHLRQARRNLCWIRNLLSDELVN